MEDDFQEQIEVPAEQCGSEIRLNDDYDYPQEKEEQDEHSGEEEPKERVKYYAPSDDENSQEDKPSIQQGEGKDKDQTPEAQTDFFAQKSVPQISEIEREGIMKEARMQRIGGTYDYFTLEMQKHQAHLASRVGVLISIFSYLEKNKITKAKTVILLKEYFEDYAEVCQDFHKKSYKNQLPKREEESNLVINTRIQLRYGMELLLGLRKNVGNEHNRISKLIKGTILKKFDSAIEVYWGATGLAEKKANKKENDFRSKEKKILTRIERVGKVYNRGKFGEDLSEDVFVEMTKFVKEQRQLRSLAFDWGREMLSMRKAVMNADHTLMSSFQDILSEFKTFNGAVYKLKKRKSNFEEQLKEQIEKKYNIENMCTPIDNDYIRGILGFKQKQNLTFLRQPQYEQFLSEEYFGFIIGDFRQLLKGAIKKVFTLKSRDEQLVRTVSDNLVLYNKKSLDVKKVMRANSTTAHFIGKGMVEIIQNRKGIIFDSQELMAVTFQTNDRAEELILSLEAEYGLEPQN